jgi:hypothetical protein
MATPPARTTAAAARSRLSKALTKHLIADFDANGVEVIAKLRKDKPVDYLKMVTAILDKDDADEAATTPHHIIVERQIIPPPPRDR